MMGYRYQLERIRINAEIFFESFVDYLNDRGVSFRKAMFGIFVVAVIMTLKSSRQSVKRVKDIGFANSVQYKSAISGNSATSNVGGYHTPPLYASTLRTPPLGGSSTTGLRGTAALGEAGSGGYSVGGYGTLARSTTTFSTAELLDNHGDTVRVVPGDFRDFGGSTDFYGQVDTLQTFEGCGVVEKVLQSPGNGKVLVVDGGGNLNSAVLDENGVKQAQRNGWKGIVVIGAIRGSKSIGSLPIGVKALGASPRKGRATTGNKGVNLSFSGIQVAPGNWIYCDKDGIVLSDRALSTSSSSSTSGAVSVDSSVSTGYGETEGIAGIYGNAALGASGAGRITPVSAYGTASTGAGSLGASPLSTGLGGTQSSLYANRVAPARTTTSGLPSAAGSKSSFNSYSHHRNYSSPGGGSKNQTMGYIIVAVCLFWIVIVLRYVGRD